MTQGQNIEENSLFRIMVATDNHLGYLENDQIRGDDSFVSFEEILKVSKNEKVDFLLLGGDLFHHHNPSKKTIIRASNILQKHVYGQKDHKFEVFCYEPNFRNENLSIELPIFIIHGNHDDPSGFENFSSIDIFSNREVNYFGKVNNYEEFDLYPILFVKGNSKIALYGIGNIKDERLYLALQNKKVNFHRPEDFKNWFNILIVHQNRFKGHHTGKNKKNYLPESFIPSFFDLVIWGHEHETFTEPVYNNEVGLHVYQPGSSVVTSLIQAESKPKCIGLLEVNLDRFRIVPLKLDTVRPFVYQQLELKSFAYRLNTQDDVEKFVEEKIEEMLIEASSCDKNEETEIQFNGLNSLRKNLPIIRLKIEFTGYQITRTNFIISKFAGKIANPGEVIQFYKKGEIFGNKNKLLGNQTDMEVDGCGELINLEDEIQDHDGELRKFVNENVSSYFVEKNKKSYFNSDFFCDALEKSVNGQERRSLELFFKTFYDNSFNSVKFDMHSQFLKELSPLENSKKDFSHVIDEILDKDELNNMIMNNIKNKRQSGLRLNLKNNEIEKDNSTDSNNNLFLNGISRSANENNNESNLNQNIKLTKANDFQNEKRENKNHMIIDRDNNKNISQIKNVNTNFTSSLTMNNIKKKSILDYIGKKSSSSSYNSLSIEENKDDFKILIDGGGLEKIDEESENLFTNKNNKNLIYGNKNTKTTQNKRLNNFKFDERNDNKKKNTKLK